VCLEVLLLQQQPLCLPLLLLLCLRQLLQHLPLLRPLLR
jgi:hypothetical protein